MSKEPLQPQDKYVLRLPDGMRDRIKAAAEKNNRSMNAEILSRLEESIGEESRIKELEDRASALETRAITAESSRDTMFTVYQFVVGMLASASGDDKKTMSLVADAIRTLGSSDGETTEERTEALLKAREHAVKQLTRTMKIAHELGLDKHGIGVKPTNFDNDVPEEFPVLPGDEDDKPDE